VETETALTAEVTENTEKKNIMAETAKDRSNEFNANGCVTSVPMSHGSVVSISNSLLLFSASSVTSVVNVFVVGV
jgi:hypothetical protein